MPPSPGDRVVLRYRLPAGSSHPMTDVLGILESTDPVTVRGSGGRVVVDRADVVALRAVPPAPVSTRSIGALEHAAALGWPGTEHAWFDGWLLRAGHGFTGRANSCLPLPPMPEDGVQRVREWYTARGLRPCFQLPDRLGPALVGWSRSEPVLVLSAPVAALAGAVVEVSADLDDTWLGAYHYPSGPLPAAAGPVLRSVVDGVLGFARITERGELLAIGRGSVTAAPDGQRWLGLRAVEVLPHARRLGLATRLCSGLATWGAEHGAQRVYLQVSADNDAARALYAGMGFTEHHRYVYARA